MISRTVAIGALAAAMTVATAACGSSKAGPSATPPSTPAPAAVASSPTVASTSDPTTSAPAVTAGGSGDDFCNQKGPSNPAFAFATAMGGGPSVDQLRHDINESLATAPSEIKPDVQTMADIELPILDGKVSQAQVEQQLDDPRLLAAMKHISSWSFAHCKK